MAKKLKEDEEKHKKNEGEAITASSKKNKSKLINSVLFCFEGLCGKM